MSNVSLCTVLQDWLRLQAAYLMSIFAENTVSRAAQSAQYRRKTGPDWPKSFYTAEKWRGEQTTRPPADQITPLQFEYRQRRPMKPNQTLPSPAVYDPNPLLDALIVRLQLKNDAALCHALDVARPVLALIRKRVIAVGAWLLQRMAEITDLSVADLRRMMGDQRVRLRVAGAHTKRNLPHST